MTRKWLYVSHRSVYLLCPLLAREEVLHEIIVCSEEKYNPTGPCDRKAGRTVMDMKGRWFQQPLVAAEVPSHSIHGRDLSMSQLRTRPILARVLGVLTLSDYHFSLPCHLS